MPNDSEVAADDAVAAFVRLDDHVDGIDRKLSALIEVITALDTRDSENAMQLAAISERLAKIGTHEQSTRAVASLAEKTIEPAITEFRATTRRIDRNLAAANAAHRSTLRQCAAMNLATVVVVTGIGALAWSSGNKSQPLQTLPTAAQAISTIGAACRPIEAPKPVPPPQQAADFGAAFRLDDPDHRKR